jgi:FtsZ-interacting cell division protein ZipA
MMMMMMIIIIIIMMVIIIIIIHACRLVKFQNKFDNWKCKSHNSIQRFVFVQVYSATDNGVGTETYRANL